MSCFKIGDKVRYVESNSAFLHGRSHVYNGYHGEIVDTRDLTYSLVGVVWNKKIKNGHDCDKRCKDGHGWYVNIEMIEYAQSKKPFIISKINILSTLKKLEQYYK